MNYLEVLQLITALMATVPGFAELIQKLHENATSSGKTMAQVLAESGGEFDTIIADAQQEIAKQ